MLAEAHLEPKEIKRRERTPISYRMRRSQNDTQRSPPSSSTSSALPAGSATLRFVSIVGARALSPLCRNLSLSSENPHNVVKRPLDIHAILRGSLNKLTSKIPSQRVAFLRRDFSFGDPVGFVAHKHYRNVVISGVVSTYK